MLRALQNKENEISLFNVLYRNLLEVAEKLRNMTNLMTSNCFHWSDEESADHSGRAV
jgi:hypothetical protein